MNTHKNGEPEHGPAGPRPDVAVYLDFENLYVSLKTTVKMDPNFDLLMEKCREFGRVTLARAYADWSEFTRIVTSQMFANGFEPVYVPTRKFYDAKTRAEARKNSVDIHITIDIIKSLYLHENVDTFILISGDRDYVPLINQIRQAGKSVYAIGVAGCTSSELSAAVDDMFFYHQLLDDEDHERTPQIDIYNQLMRAIRLARRRGYPTTLGILKPIMKELVEGFDERNYKNPRGQPFSKFKDLIQDAQSKHMVRLVTTNAVSEVYLWGEDPTQIVADRRSEAQQSAQRREEARDRGERGGGGGERGERGGGRGRRDRRERGQPRPSHRDSVAGDAAVEAAGGHAAEEHGAAPYDEAELHAAGDHELTAHAHAAIDPHRHELDETEHEEVAAPVGSEPATAMVSSDEAVARGPWNEAPAAATPRLDDRSWDVIRIAVESFGGRPPSPRKLLASLKEARDADRFGQPAPDDDGLQDLLKQAVEAGRLERQRKGFSTIYRLVERAGQEGAGADRVEEPTEG